MSTNSDTPISFYGVTITIGDTPTVPDLDGQASLRQYLMGCRAAGQGTPESITVTAEQLAKLRADVAATLDDAPRPKSTVFRLPYPNEAKSTTLPGRVVRAALDEAAKRIEASATAVTKFQIDMQPMKGEPDKNVDYVVCRIVACGEDGKAVAL